MNTMSNVVLIVMFGGMGAWLFTGWFRTRGKITIYDRRWTASRILFVVAGVMSFLTLAVKSTLLDYIRIVCMLFCIISYLLVRDGIGEEGVSCNGSFVPWQEVRGYDFQQDKKNFIAMFAVWDKASVKNGDYIMNVSFAQEDKEQVIAFLKKKIGKKYTRMKKDK